MTKTELEIIRLKWHVQILQGLIVKLWTNPLSPSSQMGELPEERLQGLLEELYATQIAGEQILLRSKTLEEKALLAEEYNQIFEEIKSFIFSMLKVNIS